MSPSVCLKSRKTLGCSKCLNASNLYFESLKVIINVRVVRFASLPVTRLHLTISSALSNSVKLKSVKPRCVTVGGRTSRRGPRSMLALKQSAPGRSLRITSSSRHCIRPSQQGRWTRSPRRLLLNRSARRFGATRWMNPSKVLSITRSCKCSTSSNPGSAISHEKSSPVGLGCEW